MPSEIPWAPPRLPVRDPPHHVLRSPQDGHDGLHAGGYHPRAPPVPHHGLCRDLQEAVVYR